MHKLLLALALCSLPFLTGCASIICGDSQVVGFTSKPDGANVQIVNKKGEVIHQGTTPFTASLKRGAGYFQGADLTLRVAKDGMPARELPLKTDVNGWYFGNILFGGLIGMVFVDPATGAMYSFPETYNADLTAPPATQPSKPTAQLPAQLSSPTRLN